MHIWLSIDVNLTRNERTKARKQKSNCRIFLEMICRKVARLLKKSFLATRVV